MWPILVAAPAGVHRCGGAGAVGGAPASGGQPAGVHLGVSGRVRFNNYVGVSAAAGCSGAQGVALAAVANAAIVPTVNILCVLVFARYGHGGDASARGIARQLLANPLVVAGHSGIGLQAAA